MKQALHTTPQYSCLCCTVHSLATKFQAYKPLCILIQLIPAGSLLPRSSVRVCVTGSRRAMSLHRESAQDGHYRMQACSAEACINKRYAECDGVRHTHPFSNLEEGEVPDHLVLLAAAAKHGQQLLHHRWGSRLLPTGGWRHLETAHLHSTPYMAHMLSCMSHTLRHLEPASSCSSYRSPRASTIWKLPTCTANSAQHKWRHAVTAARAMSKWDQGGNDAAHGARSRITHLPHCPFFHSKYRQDAGCAAGECPHQICLCTWWMCLSQLC